MSERVRIYVGDRLLDGNRRRPTISFDLMPGVDLFDALREIVASHDRFKNHAAALPHLASAQPQPSKSDEETAQRLMFQIARSGGGTKSEYDLLRAFVTARADERAKTLDECDAIARDVADEARSGDYGLGRQDAAEEIRMNIAALRAPAEKEAQG